MQYESVPLHNVIPAIGVPVNTPATQPQAFQSSTLPPKAPSTLLGAGAKGPDLMARVHLALQTQVPSEINWGLSTLLTFSTARNFELLKSRTDLLLLVADYLNNQLPIVTASTQEISDKHETLVQRQKFLEALLIVRNVCLDRTLASTLAPAVERVVSHGIQLPDLCIYSELRVLCLEILEHACVSFQRAGTDSQLFTDLFGLLSSQDKAVLIPTLRSISRICICDNKESNLNVDPAVLAKVTRYLLIDDQELISAVLEFLEQVTERISSTNDLENIFGSSKHEFVKHLVRLLSFRMDRHPGDFLRLKRRTRRPAPVFPPEIPPEIMSELLALPEPERATMWIRSSYDLEPDGEVLQVSLWSNYQKLFEPHERDGSGKRMLKAIDFIRACTTNVRGAQAKVISPPEGPKKFIIKGLVPREKAIPPSQLTSLLGNEQDKHRRPAPVYAPIAARVLKNIALLPNGKSLVKPYLNEIVEGLCINPQASDAIGRLLDVM